MPSRTQAWWTKTPLRIRSSRSFGKALLSKVAAASIVHDLRISLHADSRRAQQSDSTDSQATMRQRAHDEYERHKHAAIRINELAGGINSEADASAVVSEIAGLFAKEVPPAWASSCIRQRVANGNTRRFATQQSLSPSSALSMSGTSTRERSEHLTKRLFPSLKFTTCAMGRLRLLG